MTSATTEPFTETEAVFWYEFTQMMMEGLDCEVVHVGAGGSKMWEHVKLWNGWHKLDI